MPRSFGLAALTAYGPRSRARVASDVRIQRTLPPGEFVPRAVENCHRMGVGLRCFRVVLEAPCSLSLCKIVAKDSTDGREGGRINIVCLDPFGTPHQHRMRPSGPAYGMTTTTPVMYGC